MAQFQLLRQPQFVQAQLSELRQVAFREVYGSWGSHARRLQVRSFSGWLQDAQALRQHSRRLARSFHPPRKPHSRQLRFQSNKPSEGARPSPDPTSQLGSPSKPPLSLSERLRKLSREYGWTALGVYLALSALDFPFCFLAVRLLGTDSIAQWEQVVVRGFWNVASMPFPGGEEQVRGVFRSVGDTIRGGLETVGIRKPVEATAKEAKQTIDVRKDVGQSPDGAVLEKEWTWGVDEARKAHKDHASLATQLALAYAIHKSFIFVRVPLTAAVLPRVVRTLRGWGWNIGKRTPKSSS